MGVLTSAAACVCSCGTCSTLSWLGIYSPISVFSWSNLLHFLLQMPLALPRSFHTYGSTYGGLPPHQIGCKVSFESPQHPYWVFWVSGGLGAGAPGAGRSHLYAPLAMHEGLPTRASDDLESLCYVLVFLATGRLPWQHQRYDMSRRAAAGWLSAVAS